MGKYKLDMHVHSIASGHAYSTVTENAHYASQIGMEAIGICREAAVICIFSI